MKKIKYIIKYSPIFYNLYFSLLSSALRILGLFVRTDEKLILFNSFGGRKYDDSPKAIFETMIHDHRFDEYTFVWALSNPESYQLPDKAVIVKDYTFQFFVYALKAKVWITNSSMEHGLSFKKKSTIYINTWHGSAIKFLGDDVKEGGRSFKGKGSTQPIAFFTQSEFDEYVFARAFHMPATIFKRFGLPRNDELTNYCEERVSSVKASLHIPKDKKIVLYAPTFREYSRGNGNGITQEIRIDLERWETEFGGEYILLVRAHYEVVELLDFSIHQSVINVSDYPHLNDLLIISDALISDYSSIFFDYSILHRPMLCFAYDLDEYIKNRGMYLDIGNELPCMIIKDNSSLFNEIRRVFDNYETERLNTVEFQKKYVPEYGHASEQTCEYLSQILKKENLA